MAEGKKLGGFVTPYKIGAHNGLTRQMNLRLTDEEMDELVSLAAKTGKRPTSMARAVFVLGLDVARGDFYALAEKAGVEPDVPEEDAAILGRKP